MAPRDVNIQIVRHTAHIPFELRDVIHPVLSCPRKRFLAAGETGVRMELQTDEFLTVGRSSHIVTSAGLIPRLASELDKQGYTVHVQDRTSWTMLEMADKAVPCDPDDRGMLNVVSSTPRGQIVVDREHDIPAVMALLVQFFVSARVLVVCNNQEATDKTHRALGHLLGKGVYLHTDVNWADQRRVVIGTEQSLSSSNDLDWDVIVFVGAETAIHQEPARRAAKMQNQLLYCIRTDDRQLGKYESMRLECICGPEIWRVPGAERRQAEVSVLMAQGPVMHRYRQRGQQSALERKRETIWHNDARNRQIAQLATGLVDGDVETLWEHGLLLQEDEGFLRRMYGNPRVAVLVESTEHGEALLGLLDGWKLLNNTRNREAGDNVPHGHNTPSALNRGAVTPPDAGHLPADSRDRVIGGQFPSGTKGAMAARGLDDAQIQGDCTRNRGVGDETPGALNRVIVTQVAASRMQLDVDVIVWAGGEQAPQLPMGFAAGSTACSLGQDQREQLWVDIADDWDQDAVEATRRRVGAYGRRGWRGKFGVASNHDHSCGTQ